MCEVIAITSGKGGVGKTTITKELGNILAEKGYKRLVIDMDIGLRNLDVVMGLETKVRYNLIDLLQGNCRVKQALLMDRRRSFLYMIPSSYKHDSHDVDLHSFEKILNELKEQFEYILLDSPAGAEQGFLNAVSCADRMLLVTTTDITAIRDAHRILQIMQKNQHLIPTELIINKFMPQMIMSGECISVDDIRELLDIEIAGTIPFSKSTLISYNNMNRTIKKNTYAYSAMNAIADHVLGRSHEDIHAEKYDTIWRRLNWRFDRS